MGGPINLPPYGSEFITEGAILSTLKADPQPDPNMTVYVSPGGLWMNGRTYIEWGGGNSGVFSAPGSQAKWDLLVYNYSGFLQIIQGTPSANPALPNAPRNSLVLACIYLQSTTTKITSENLFDMRPVMNNCMFSHKDMEDRIELNQHPIQAITNLQDTLNLMPTNVDLATALTTKADIGGTPDVTFVMNQDLTGTPSSDVKIEIERGLNTNVDIRWNEAINDWDYTNDGSARYRFQPNIFTSSEQIGTGASQLIPHGLSRVPFNIFVSVTDNSAGSYTIVEGGHDATNVNITITSGIKYKVMAY